MDKLKKFTPTTDMITAAGLVFMAMAWVETIRPIVNKYQQEIIDDMKPVSDSKWPNAGLLITSNDMSYLMSDADFTEYFARTKIERDKAGLKVENDDFCPLLVAEEVLQKAECVLIDTMEPVTNLGYDTLTGGAKGIENRKKYVELTLKLLAPFVDPKSILSHKS